MFENHINDIYDDILCGTQSRDQQRNVNNSWTVANYYGMNERQIIIRFIFRSDLTRINNVFRYPQVN